MDEYLFTGDTIWFGADGGYSFLSTLAEDNKLSVKSLEILEENLKNRSGKIKKSQDTPAGQMTSNLESV